MVVDTLALVVALSGERQAGLVLDALAEDRAEPLLFVGDDFARSDVKPVFERPT